jgi:Metallo-peptidase family M12B Reprolysin-like
MIGVENAFARKSAEEIRRVLEPQVHVMQDGIVCDTDSRGYPTPGNRDPLDLVVDASEGFIPLWAPDVTLRWRFQQRSLDVFVDPEAAAAYLRDLLGRALLAWGAAAPIDFTHDEDRWDFEIAVNPVDKCTPSGCVLARAFFPDAGRHELTVFPKMFGQSDHEQVDTIAHEIGHTFGLRHFFAQVSETAWPSQIFGEHQPFSIMNYGSLSELTALDRSDLTALYQQVWSGELTHINGTPIRLVHPFSGVSAAPDGVVTISRAA